MRHAECNVLCQIPTSDLNSPETRFLIAASIPIGITLIAPARSFPRICNKKIQCLARFKSGTLYRERNKYPVKKVPISEWVEKNATVRWIVKDFGIWEVWIVSNIFCVLGVVWVLAVAGYQQSIERCFHDYVVHKAVLCGGATWCECIVGCWWHSTRLIAVTECEPPMLPPTPSSVDQPTPQSLLHPAFQTTFRTATSGLP